MTLKITTKNVITQNNSSSNNPSYSAIDPTSCLKLLTLGLTAFLFFNSCSTMNQSSISRELGQSTTHKNTASQSRQPASSESTVLDQMSKQSVVTEEINRAPQSLTLNRYFDWPIDEARLTRGYSADPIPHPKKRRKKRPHWGIDLAAHKGTPIYASHHGTIIYAGKDFKGYGKMVLIEGENGWASIYAHFDKITVKEGQKVRQGDLVGLMGKTGRVTGVHLHFEIRQHKEAYDPLMFLPNGEKISKQLTASNKTPLLNSYSNDL